MNAIVLWVTQTLALKNSGIPDTSLAAHTGLKDLDVLIETLSKYPGMGKSLVLTGLRSEGRYNRKAAAKVLTAWETSSWPIDAMTLLEQALESEKDEETCKQLKAAIANGFKEN